MAKSIMFQGTASNVGKSMMATALCRILYKKGFKVAPFKSWNMALNSYVTKNGGEVGRAQALQAESCGIEVDVNMQPFLVKPKGNGQSQVIVQGKPLGDFGNTYKNEDYVEWALKIIEESIKELFNDYEIVVMEGAGSPAEINIEHRDLANMKVAKLFKTPVILVADIDKGGVFASIVGTLELLGNKKELVKGIIINKFRGSKNSLQSGLDYIKNKTGVPILGVIPNLKDISLPEEDSVTVNEYLKDGAQIMIGVINLPRLSNFTDFDVLGMEPIVELNYLDGTEKNLNKYDVIIIPGTKNTTGDLAYLKGKGIDKEIKNAARNGVEIIGICGGYQMLGSKLLDPQKTEGKLEAIEGLSLLDMKTEFSEGKDTFQVKAEALAWGDYFFNPKDGEIKGYEIHMGNSETGEKASPLFKIKSRSGQNCNIKDGAVSDKLEVWGTYLHGIFDNDNFREKFIKHLLRKKDKEDKLDLINFKERREKALDRLAEEVEKNLNMKLLNKILGIE